MNAITDIWRELVRRRLWPVALLLVAALVAVPMLLARQPETTVPAAAPAHASTKPVATSAFVEPASDDAAGGRRRVLGEKKDPFEPKPLPKHKKQKKKATTAKASTDTATVKPPDDAPAAGGAAPGTAPTSAVPPVATPPAPKRTAPLNSIKVRFGKTGGEGTTTTLERLQALPSAASPVLVYMGIKDGGKVAVFMLSGDVTAEGDGTCDPDPGSCQTLKLRAGETEFLDVKDTGGTDGQYEIDVEAIHAKTTASAAQAKAAHAKARAARGRTHASL